MGISYAFTFMAGAVFAIGISRISATEPGWFLLLILSGVVLGLAVAVYHAGEPRK